MAKPRKRIQRTRRQGRRSPDPAAQTAEAPAAWLTPIERVHVAITLEDDTLEVMEFPTAFATPARVRIFRRLATAEAIEAELAKDTGRRAPVRSWRFIETTQLPSDRSYRIAWRDRGPKKGVHHDMPAAREWHKQLLRSVRGPKLEELDTDYMRALERNDTTALKKIAKEKQQLRDITADPAIAKAATPAALRSSWPFDDPFPV